MKKQSLWMVILLVVVCAVGCQRKTSGEWIDSCPHATVYLQPYDNFTQTEAGRLKAELEKHWDELLGGAFEVVVLPNKQLPSDFLGETKTKYSIDKIIHSLEEKFVWLL